MDYSSLSTGQARNWTPRALGWAAGYFEGEGSIVFLRKTGSPQLSLVSTDLDSITRFKDICGVGSIFGPRSNNGRLGKKPLYRYCTAGFQNVQALVAAFWDYLGQRRQEQCAKALLASRERGLGSKARQILRFQDGKYAKCGHDANEENTYTNPKTKRTFCKTCRTAYMAAYFQNNKNKQEK